MCSAHLLRSGLQRLEVCLVYCTTTIHLGSGNHLIVCNFLKCWTHHPSVVSLVLGERTFLATGQVAMEVKVLQSKLLFGSVTVER